MSSELLDDLSRALVEPMPRRRVLRLLGTALLASAVPGLSAGSATAARAVRGAHCVGDREECPKDIANGVREHYCCPAPSWKWQCGSKSNGYRCSNTCVESVNQFPCTATEEDPDAGINGQCCNRRVHVGCHERSIPTRNIKAGTCESCTPEFPSICIPLRRGKGRCCKLGEKCCANDVSSACCGPDQTCGYPRKRNGALDPKGTVTCRCKPGRGTSCGRDCCENDEVCCGPPAARVCCPAGEFCFWKEGEDALVPLGGGAARFGTCRRGCTPGNTAGRHCCGTGYRFNARRTGCVPT